MRKLCVVFFTIIAVALLCSFLGFGNNFSTKRKIAFKICDRLSKDFKYKYGLHYMGISEEAADGKYKRIGLDFRYPHVLSKDEGRDLLLNCVLEALDVFNSYPEFKQYMANYPFDGNNILVNIYIEPPRIRDVYYPDIGLFSFFNDTLWYMTYNRRTGYKFYTEEKESYEVAQRIVEAQSRGELSFTSNRGS